MKYLLLFAVVFSTFLPTTSFAIDMQSCSLGTSEGYYALAMQELCKQDYKMARRMFLDLIRDFPYSKEVENSHFWIGVIEFENGNIEKADEYFGNYLRTSSDQLYFQKALDYRFYIAERCALGQKVRPFKMRALPTFLPGDETAIEILEDITGTIQTHDYSARAYYLKGYLYWKKLYYKEAIANYQSLIRKFPKHELTPDAHLAIMYVWKCIAVHEPQNPDVLDLAKLSLEEFRKSFPSSPNLCEAEQIIFKIQEILARALVRTGQYYSRKGCEKAANVYYQRAVSLYPDTEWGESAAKFLDCSCS